jgi:hypothetical protein
LRLFAGINRPAKLRAADIYTSLLSFARTAAGEPRVAGNAADELCTGDLHGIELHDGVELVSTSSIHSSSKKMC